MSWPDERFILAEALHIELKPAGVDVRSVAPGPVATGFGSRAGLALPSPTTPEVVADAAWEALRATRRRGGALQAVL